jgi:hypothetical protein
VKKSILELENEKKVKEEAAQQELADLLNMNSQPMDTSASSSNKKEKKPKEQLDKVDKVYHEMK